jgi:hypothetical protein
MYEILVRSGYWASTADGSQVSREEAAISFWAWRCLYAEVVGARKDNRCMVSAKAYANLVRMAYTRVKAYGATVSGTGGSWYSRQHRKKDAKVVPMKHRENKLITQEASVEYRINPVLYEELADLDTWVSSTYGTGGREPPRTQIVLTIIAFLY